MGHGKAIAGSACQNLGDTSWTPEQREAVGRTFTVLTHRLHERPLFDDSALVRLLERHPRTRLQCYTMPLEGDNVGAVHPADTAGCTGEDLLAAVKKGHFWFNLRAANCHHDRYTRLFDEMVPAVQQRLPMLKDARDFCLDVMISSPGAHTHFHVDRGPNLLWHVRGEKDVWVYPANNTAIVRQSYLEDIHCGERIENLPWQPGFDRLAEKHTIFPGDIASWPNGAPHRVESRGLCVSLNLSFSTPDSEKMAEVHCANRYLLRPLGLTNRSTQVHGMSAFAKRWTYRLTNLLGMNRVHDYRLGFTTRLKVDAQAPLGLAETDMDCLPVFMSG